METPVPDNLPEPSVVPSEPPMAAPPIVEAVPPVESAPPVVEAAPPAEAAVSGPAMAAETASVFGVGFTLRTAREKMGKTLAECSKQLRIRQPFLEALEEGRHGDLPGGTYAAGFLRTYSEFLHLDGEELVRRFRQEGAGGFATRAELSFPSPVSEGRIPGGAVIFLGVVLAAVAYGGWYMLSSHETKVAEMVPPLPDRLSTILSRQAALTGDSKATPQDPIKPGDEQGKVKEDVVPPAEVEEDKPAQPPLLVAPVEQTSVAPPKAEPAKVEPVKVEVPKAEPVKTEPAKVEAAKVEPPKAEPAKVEPPKAEVPKAEASAVEGKVFGTEFADARVVLKASGDDCWVQVREMDGSLLVSRLLRRGDSYRVPNRPGLSLMVGNAGSLEVSIDGRKGPALGSVGQVRRDIRLDPDKLSSGG